MSTTTTTSNLSERCRLSSRKITENGSPCEISRLRISRVRCASCLSCNEVSETRRSFHRALTISRELKGTPESRFNLEEEVTKTANSPGPLDRSYAAEFSIRSLVKCCAYVLEVCTLHVHRLPCEIMPGCTYPSDCRTEIGKSGAHRKPIVALNSW